MDLTPSEVDQLRSAVIRPCRQQAPTVPGVFIGGPLDGLTIPLEVRVAEGDNVGWCVVSRAGLVQANYKPDLDGRWVAHRTKCRRGTGVEQGLSFFTPRREQAQE